MSNSTRIDTNHRDMIHDAAMDFYGRRLATCSSDKHVRVFDVLPSGQHQQLCEMLIHEGPVWSVAWSHPKFESLLASCSYDKTVIIWKELEPGNWQQIHKHTAHEASVNAIAWAPYQLGCQLACASVDKSVTILSYVATENAWKVERIANAHDNGVNAVSWCPYVPSSVALSDPQAAVTARIVTGGNDSLVKIWKKEMGQEGSEWIVEKVLQGHADWVRDVAWAPCPSPKRQIIASCGLDKRVLLWTQLGGGEWSAMQLTVTEDTVWHVSWSVCGSMLAVASGENQVALWRENMKGQWKCISEEEEKSATSDSN